MNSKPIVPTKRNITISRTITKKYAFTINCSQTSIPSIHTKTTSIEGNQPSTPTTVSTTFNMMVDQNVKKIQEIEGKFQKTNILHDSDFLQKNSICV